LRTIRPSSSADGRMPPFSAMAVQAIDWTKERVLPWMLKRGSGIIGKLLRGHLARQQRNELLLTAAALPAQACLRISLICTVNSKHGLFVENGKAKIAFAIRLTAVAPFGIRPHSISAKCVVRRAEEGDANRTRADVVSIEDRKTTNGFMGPGDWYDIEVDRELAFKELPAAGTTMVLWVDGTVTALGPWVREYSDAKFEQDIYVPCRHGY
jgi:hypothetical protein